MVVVIFAWMLLLPTSYWIKDSSIVVLNSDAGRPLQIEYDGVIVRPFNGKYSVTITDVLRNQIVCDAIGGPIPYSVGHNRPDPLYMNWWAVSDERCYGENMQEGVYSMTTCWDIKPRIGDWIFPISKTHCITTDRYFTISSPRT